MVFNLLFYSRLLFAMKMEEEEPSEHKDKAGADLGEAKVEGLGPLSY